MHRLGLFADRIVPDWHFPFADTVRITSQGFGDAGGCDAGRVVVRVHGGVLCNICNPIRPVEDTKYPDFAFHTKERDDTGPVAPAGRLAGGGIAHCPSSPLEICIFIAFGDTSRFGDDDRDDRDEVGDRVLGSALLAPGAANRDPYTGRSGVSSLEDDDRDDDFVGRDLGRDLETDKLVTLRGVRNTRLRPLLLPLRGVRNIGTVLAVRLSLSTGE